MRFAVGKGVEGVEPCHRKMMQLCSGAECSGLALNFLRAASLGLWSPQV